MTKKNRTILLSVMTAVLCLALMAAGTYALFSDSVTLTNHMEAGTLDITLTRNYLRTKTYNSGVGDLWETEQKEKIDFSGPTKRNVFDITNETLMIPGCYYFAEMQIDNKSDVAFGYWFEIVFENKDKHALAEQLLVTVKTAKGESSARLSESVGTIGDESAPVGILAVGDSALFTIEVEFLSLSSEANNAAKGQSLNFDVIVHAVQIPSAQ